MAEAEKPRKSLSSGKDFKVKNPFSRVKDDGAGGGMVKTSSSMRKSWSTDSLALLASGGRLGKTTCVCAPTKHEGSFRCRLHRSSVAAGHDAPPPAPPLLLPKSLLSSHTEDDHDSCDLESKEKF